jgi:hypothetical protein
MILIYISFLYLYNIFILFFQKILSSLILRNKNKMEFINEDEDTYLHFVKRNNYLTKIVQENERIKNEKLRIYVNTTNHIKILKERVKELEDIINKDKENYIISRDNNINNLKKLKGIINEYMY